MRAFTMRPSVMRRLVRETRGAAVIEALVTLPFFFAFFSAIVQLCYLELAGLATQHAAIVAARAAVVVAADDPKYYSNSGTGSLSGKRGAEVEEGVKNALRISTEDPKVRLTFTGSYGEGGTVRSRLEFDYPCGIPVGGVFVCGLSRVRRITREAAMPSQAAGYTYP